MMQNPVIRFKESSFISEKPGYLSEKPETLTSSGEILYVFPSYQCLQKTVQDFFYFV